MNAIQQEINTRMRTLNNEGYFANVLNNNPHIVESMIAERQRADNERAERVQLFDTLILYGQYVATIQQGYALAQDMTALVNMACTLRGTLVELLPEYAATLPVVPVQQERAY